MKLRFLGSLAAVIALFALAANAGDQKCQAAARECEQQIRQMLSGPRYLGVEVVQLNTGSPSGGPVVVKTVLPKSPASRAPLLPGDWLIAVNGRPTPRVADFKKVVAEARQTGTLWLIVRRRNALRKVDIRLEPYPKEYVDKVIAGHLSLSHTATASGSRP
ncbi:MAG TPA: PDZ domain-containing protein [Thermoanaerobaculia bacterium]|nr:PDZ domain-containing protein [Thermoanaerobaculia bacterium]